MTSKILEAFSGSILFSRFFLATQRDDAEANVIEQGVVD
jgi:hypothetical protein